MVGASTNIELLKTEVLFLENVICSTKVVITCPNPKTQYT